MFFSVPAENCDVIMKFREFFCVMRRRKKRRKLSMFLTEDPLRILSGTNVRLPAGSQDWHSADRHSKDKLYSEES